MTGKDGVCAIDGIKKTSQDHSAYGQENQLFRNKVIKDSAALSSAKSRQGEVTDVSIENER